MQYVFDTNSFRVLENYYPERFVTFWERFNQVVDDRTVISVREVYNEVENQVRPTWLLDWAKQRRTMMFLTPGSAETAFVANIFKVPHFRTLVGATQVLRGSAVADPFIVACARVAGGCVVTEEAYKPNAAKIPNVCEHFGVECTSMEGFLDRMGWMF